MKKLSLIFICFLLSISLSAQDNLLDNEKAYQALTEEYKSWLDSNGIATVFTVRNLEVYVDQLILNLDSNYATDDSLKTAWNILQKDYYEKTEGRISEKMHNYFTFLYGIEPTQAKLIIHGNQYSNTHMRMFYELDSDSVDMSFVLEEEFPQVQAGGVLEIPMKELRLPKTAHSTVPDKAWTIPDLQDSIEVFLERYYKSKSKGWYTVRVNKKSYHSEFRYRVTCIYNEIINEGYYESIEIKIILSNIDNTFRMQYDILGKYGPYLLCPEEKDRFYKSIDTHYPNKLEEYAEHINKMLEAYLRKR